MAKLSFETLDEVPVLSSLRRIFRDVRFDTVLKSSLCIGKIPAQAAEALILQREFLDRCFVFRQNLNGGQNSRIHGIEPPRINTSIWLIGGRGSMLREVTSPISRIVHGYL